MRICIDSCVFIRGLQQTDPSASRLLNVIGPGLILIVPRLVVQEVTRNLATPLQVRYFYRLFHESDFAFVVDEPVPADLLAKYVALGLRQKADAFIGAFVEWMQAEYLISDNRHFLRELSPQRFQVVQAETFLAQWENQLTGQ